VSELIETRLKTAEQDYQKTEAGKSGSWDYRVVIREFEDGEEPEYAIHEAHYDDDVMFVTPNPVGETCETLERLAEELELMAKALDAPPLRYKDYRVPVGERGDIQPMREVCDEA